MLLIAVKNKDRQADCLKLHINGAFTYLESHLPTSCVHIIRIIASAFRPIAHTQTVPVHRGGKGAASQTLLQTVVTQEVR